MSQIDETAMSANDRRVLNNFMEEAMAILQAQADSRDSYKDLVKKIAEDLSIPPAALRKAAKLSFTSSQAKDREAQEVVESILVATGRTGE